MKASGDLRNGNVDFAIRNWPAKTLNLVIKMLLLTCHPFVKITTFMKDHLENIKKYFIEELITHYWYSELTSWNAFPPALFQLHNLWKCARISASLFYAEGKYSVSSKYVMANKGLNKAMWRVYLWLDSIPLRSLHPHLRLFHTKVAQLPHHHVCIHSIPLVLILKWENTGRPKGIAS